MNDALAPSRSTSRRCDVATLLDHPSRLLRLEQLAATMLDNANERRLGV